jgi:Skp family chaperone for outer membrane proteins
MYNRFGQLAVDAFPLERFGLAKRYPRLVALQKEVADLDARRAAADGELVALRQGVGPAKQKDAEAGAKALRAGSDMPQAKHETAAHEKVREAERKLAALENATAEAAQDLTGEQRKHSGALIEDLGRARAEAAKRVAEQAASLLSDYGLFLDAEDIGKRFAPPAPVPDESAPAQDTTFVIHAPRATPTGPQRGDVESVLSHLASLEADDG